MLRTQTIINKIEKFVAKCSKKYEQKMDYRIEEDKNENGKIVRFYYDSTLYEIIEYYLSDGFNPFGLGEEFDNLMSDFKEHYMSGIFEFYVYNS